MSPRWRTLDGAPTRIIAHRGASGVWPEHTLPAYLQALDDGADVLEPDLVVSRDAQLIVRHDRGLARSTDVATHPAFAPRRSDGDWRVDAFDAAELEALCAIQPFAQRDRGHDGLHPVPTFATLLHWCEAQAAARGGALTIYPELKHPAAFAAAGLDPVPLLVDALRGAEARGVRAWFQCFEAEPLQRVRVALGLPVFLLIDAGTDWQATLAHRGGEVDGLGADKRLLLDAQGRDSGLVAEAHARGLQVHAWTYRDDVASAGFRDVRAELELAFELGVDAVFCDFPATGVACRAAWTPS